MILRRIKYLRRIYYNLLIAYVERHVVTSAYLCHYHFHNKVPWYLEGFCWSDMKEVWDNRNSEYLRCGTRGNPRCGMVCFKSNDDRIAFLKECIALLDKK